MFRNMLTAFGFGFLLLWITGLATASSHTVAWLDLVMAFMSFIGAGNTTARTYKGTIAKGILGLSAAVFALTLYSFRNLNIQWQNFWNLTLACALLGLGILAATSKTKLTAVSNYRDDKSNRAA